MAEVRSELLEGGTLLRLTLDAPPGNILTGAVMEQLTGALVARMNERSLRMAVLQGAGGNFSFGASVEEHRKAAAPAMLAGFTRLVRSVARFPVPVAAMVEGRCLGGGFELALACHLLFVTPRATLGCPEIKLGVFPPVLAALGPARLGGALSDRLVLTGETISGAELKPIATVVEGFDQFLEWYRKGPARMSAAALRIATHAVRGETLDGRLDWLNRLYVEDVLASRDGNEGIEAFIGKRAPVWEDA